MFRYLLISLLLTIKSNRSPAAIYHILTGKKSSQTIQDLHVFQLHPYYRLLPNLTRQDFDEVINTIVDQGLMTWVNKKDYILTDEASAYLKTHADIAYYFHSLAQPVDESTKHIFTERLYLTIQTFTYRVMNERGFIPVTDDVTIQAFVKQYYHVHKERLSDWLEACYEHLYEVLKTYPEVERHIFLDRLSTYNHSGRSLQQLMDRYETNEADIRLTLALIERDLLYRSQQAHTCLADLLPGKKNNQSYHPLMTRSAQKTHQLVMKGHNIDELIQMRQLKRGTIEDHLVEICTLDNHFKLDDYVTEEKITMIESYLSKRETQKLGEIKRKLPEDISYLDLRLVFAHYQKRLYP
ncbi:MAG: helix-turn-helix domain-containing protein [Bacillota bacterium]